MWIASAVRAAWGWPCMPCSAASFYPLPTMISLASSVLAATRMLSGMLEQPRPRLPHQQHAALAHPPVVPVAPLQPGGQAQLLEQEQEDEQQLLAPTGLGPAADLQSTHQERPTQSQLPPPRAETVPVRTAASSAAAAAQGISRPRPRREPAHLTDAVPAGTALWYAARIGGLYMAALPHGNYALPGYDASKQSVTSGPELVSMSICLRSHRPGCVSMPFVFHSCL